MDVAYRFAELSHARRLHVGAIVVKDDRIISIGYNGMPAGWDNDCEDKVWTQDGDYGFKTKAEVLHAERNALDKLAKSGGVGGNAADMFTTHAPCLECAKSILGAGIRQLFYSEDYRDDAGIVFLQKSNILVEKLEKESKADN